jgi:alkanesulfonate monooxygenase SsuD/methylene tetrahydromethanopterin reductase-like flavin-dependent oxidoreductase (luciferase family)
VKALLTGQPTTLHGEFFPIQDAIIRPAPDPEIPILVGGRSDAALRRTAEYGDGWLALWVSAQRFAAAVGDVEAQARKRGREVEQWQHGLVLWCATPGSDGRGGQRLAQTMQERYKLPFDRFSRWCPVGHPDELADYAWEYVEAGSSQIAVTLPAGSPLESVTAAGQVREALLTREKATWSSAPR